MVRLTARLAPTIALNRSAIAVPAALVVLAGLAWALTGARMGEMGMDGMGLGSLGFFLGVWAVMMGAMMFPSIAPMVTVYDRLRAAHRRRGRGAPADATALFVAGYLVAWTAIGAAAYGAFALVGERGGSLAAGAVIALAAAYQLSPAKDACLTRCRGPLMFLAEHWTPGRLGALRMGAIHGAWCIGCCWALMAALFALGVMSLGWMALVAALIAVEKLWPRPAPAKHLVAGILAALAVGVVVQGAL